MVIADTLLNEPWSAMEIFNLPARFNLPVIKYLVWGWQTRRILAQWQPDILHAHRLTAAGWIGALCGFRPLVLTPWGSDLYQFPQRSRLAAWLTRWVLKNGALVTADSQDLRRLAIQYGANPEHTYLVQWGVDLRLFHPVISKEQIKNEWGFAGKIVIYSPRNMHPLYNQDILLDAAPAIAERFPNVVIVLRDLNTDPVYRQELQAKIRSLSLGNRVHVIGRMAWEATIPLYQMSDLVISIPSSDGTPVSVLEAMACGAPVITSDLPSLREWISDMENGLLVPPRDSAKLAKTVIEALSQPMMLEKFSRANLDLVAVRADHHKEMKKMESLYLSFLTRQPGVSVRRQ